jgi:demethylmenaquinone methyltransferase/2-methoxy-6-polyprenyl-1,4-benzoquinol methylase
MVDPTDPSAPAAPEQASFGYRTVPAAEKAGMVRQVFESVAPRYDLMNDLMSGGVHRLWKNTLVDVLNPRPGEKFLDVAGGTGDVAFRIYRRQGERPDVAVCDINAAMLAVGRDRAADRGLLKGLSWTTGDAESLPFPDRSFDGYTIAFGLRNVTDIDKALGEAHRVLKPGGRFYCLEFS